MRKSIFKTFNDTIKHWYIPAIVGSIFIVVGIYTFASPATSYVALSILFSLSFLFSGISEIVFSLTNRNEMDNWGWVLAFGILTTVIGGLLLSNPAVSMATLTFYVGFLILFRSISALSFSLDLKDYGIGDWGALMALSVIGLIFSIIMIWNPAFAGMTIVIWTGLAFITTGIFSLYMAFKLKKLNELPQKMSEDLKLRHRQLQQEISEINKQPFRQGQTYDHEPKP
ncbi:HdeD family acid-resistance protein [Psychrobacter sanguinis]|uniref:HdeD family acid-resistance protein n=1 Tax=Psychrobacter sanguinis TaxID=861445 RepID=UPI00020C9445|nr:HdeD family acid-resistance protein [Psychrobacter sanguinis]EGK13254.1 brp/Blh family beta-carotene 15,15'-monooxygenase [Psychrobacter sp. 1501(2011)]MCC3308966.1 HdeD family acid-resistance protein [Psychrobacter sanguinis]MCD9150325.1 HdeD family acid-resistance protein [Psychrobacter sanguinis]UEC26256.1 HdeD family acid-resistance protein [Psychrobacter sanguinis]